MDSRNFQRMLRVIWAYVAVGIILLICLCTGLWTLFENVLRFASDVLQNMFEIRWNASLIEFEDGTSEEALQTSSESTNPPSNYITLDHISSSTFSDLSEKVNTAVEIATDKQVKHCQVSPKDNFSSLEGLALQMVLQEQNRMRTDLSRPASSECYERSQNETTPENPPAPKSVLKSPSSEGKYRTSIRGTRRIRFQEPLFEVSKGSQSGSISPKKPATGSSRDSKLRKSISTSHLKTGLNFQESPASSSEREICNPVQSPGDLQTESSSIHAKMATNQQLVDEKVDSLSEKFNTNIPSTLPLSSETADNQQKAKESIDSLRPELISTLPTTCEDFKESPEVDYQRIEPETMESRLKLKADDKSLLEHISEGIPDEKKLKKVELHYELPVKQEIASFNEKEENPQKSYTDDIHELPEKSNIVSDGQSLQAMNLLPKSVCHQSTEESINANQRESTLDEFNPPICKADEELGKSIKPEMYSKLRKVEATVITDDKVGSLEGKVEATDVADDEEPSREEKVEATDVANDEEPSREGKVEATEVADDEEPSREGKVEATDTDISDEKSSREGEMEATDIADEEEPSREGKMEATDIADKEEISRERKMEATDFADEEEVSRERKVEATDTADEEKVSREGEVEATDIADEGEALREGKEAKVITDDEETSRKISTKMLSERENENLRKDSSEKTEAISCIDEEVPLKNDKNNVSEASKTVDDDILQTELETDQQSADYKCYPVKKRHLIKKKRGKK